MKLSAFLASAVVTVLATGLVTYASVTEPHVRVASIGEKIVHGWVYEGMHADKYLVIANLKQKSKAYVPVSEKVFGIGGQLVYVFAHTRDALSFTL